MKRLEIVEEALRYEQARTPWRHRGRTITGVDCVGLVCCVADHFGVTYQDVDGYNRNPDGRFVDHLLRYMVVRHDSSLKDGSVVVLRDAHHPCHVGIIQLGAGGKPYIIHSSLRARPPRVVREEYAPLWSSRLRCVLDYPGVED